MQNHPRSATRRRARATHRSRSAQPISQPQPAPVSLPIPDWVQHECAHAEFGDQRLRPRLDRLLADFARQPQASIPQACGSWSQTLAAYRFFDNDKVCMHSLLASHQQATLERMRAHRVILVAQDTVFLNFSPHPATRGLGPIGSTADGALGLVLHSTLALTPDGTPLGVLDAQCWARDPKQCGKRASRRARALDEKESRKWLESVRVAQALCAEWEQTQIVAVSDCESDVYELFALACSRPDGPAVLVRARHDRALATTSKATHSKRLFAFLRAQPVARTIQVRVPRRPGQKERIATLEVRHTPVTLRPPEGKAAQGPLSVWAVEAREVHPPRGVTPICWRLVTTLPVETAEQAVEKVQWYGQRWRIEEWHRVLKSGCRVEDRQLQTAERLQRVVALDMIVAWRILWLTKLGRGAETGALPATEVVTEAEWEILYVYFHRRGPERGYEPTVREVVQWIGRLGGHLGRKRDGYPGPMVLWRGLHRLHDLVVGVELAEIRKGKRHECNG